METRLKINPLQTDTSVTRSSTTGNVGHLHGLPVADPCNSHTGFQFSGHCSSEGWDGLCLLKQQPRPCSDTGLLVLAQRKSR